MRRFLVGGAVRDTLRGVIPHDRDYVVVGASPEQMLGRGFQQVGRDFPVFLHPETGEEHALARVERKIGQGYHGFAADWQGVSIEEDLARRDLTINAMAMGDDNQIVDPFNGHRDLQAGILRHVSPAFAEDPLRVLRTARFAAQFGFVVAPETLELMAGLVDSGELDTLTAERVTAELIKALTATRPSAFFRVLDACGALRVVLPEVYALIGVTQPIDHHPEGDVFMHTMLCVDIPGSIDVRFGALCHDLGKALTPRELWPKHHGHDAAGVPVVERLSDRLHGITISMRDTAILATRLHMKIRNVVQMRPATILRLIRETDAIRRPERLQAVIGVAVADERGRQGFEHVPCTWIPEWYRALEAIKTIDAGLIAHRAIDRGKDPKDAIQAARLAALKKEKQ